MIIEYYINSIDEKEIDIKNNIDNIIQFPISGILSSISHVKFLKKKFPNIKLGCFIDYPIANSDLERRQDLIQDAINAGSNYIAITIPFFDIINRKYSKFRNDIKKNLELCIKNNINIRYILEYRKFDHQLLTKVCEILMENTIDVVYPSTGLFLDNIEDNIIACAYLHEKTGIKTIVNGNIWRKSQIDNLLKIQPYGLSINQISSFNLIDPSLYDS